MGYWSDFKPKGQSFKIWATKKYTWEDDNIIHRVIDAALLHRTTGYLACERISKKDGVRYIYCMVLLVRWENDKYSRWNMMVKEVDETCGPVEYHCPEKIFKLLSPIRKLRVMGDGYKWVKEWRKSVIAYHAKRKIINTVSNGDIIRFDKPINFVGGRRVYEFYVADKSKGLYEDNSYRMNLYKLPNSYMINNQFTII
jgi:hypothetical protein